MKRLGEEIKGIEQAEKEEKVIKYGEVQFEKEANVLKFFEEKKGRRTGILWQTEMENRK